MKLNTKYFGEIDYETRDLISFPNGLFGFEDEHAFLLIPFKPDNQTLLCLQSASTPALAFVLMDPFSIYAKYAPVPQPSELSFLGVEECQDLSYYTMCMVKSPVSESTVNLKCPIAINADTRVAQQIILDGDTYHMRHRLADLKAEEGAVC